MTKEEINTSLYVLAYTQNDYFRKVHSELIQAHIHEQGAALADALELARWVYPPPDGVISYAALAAREFLKKYGNENI